jgi:ammonia channel protein AmtB
MGRLRPNLGARKLIKAVDFVLGLRVPEHEEDLGLDLVVHGEVAYQG